MESKSPFVSVNGAQNSRASKREYDSPIPKSVSTLLHREDEEKGCEQATAYNTLLEPRPFVPVCDTHCYFLVL